MRCAPPLREKNQNIEKKWSGRRGSNPRPPAWKAGALPTELHPLRFWSSYTKNGGAGRIRTFEGIHRQIYSLLPLAAREPRPNFNKWSCSQESNLRPSVYKTDALPTELEQPDSHHHLVNNEE